MFDKTSEHFKEQLVKELVLFETQLRNEEITSVSHYKAGTVKYTTPTTSGEIDLVINVNQTTSTDRGSLVRFESGVVAIMIPRDIYLSAQISDLINLIAHELGHLISGHMGNTQISFPNLYIEEVKRTFEERDTDNHIYWSTKAIVDGGYLPIELEADLIASKLVGFNNVCFMQLSESFIHQNPTVVLEKYNRLKQLSDILKDVQTPADGYEFELIMDH